MNRTVVIGVVVTVVLLIGGIFGYQELQRSQAAALQREITQAISRDRPALTDKDKPLFDIISITQPETGWYIVTIKSIHEKTMTVPVKLILNDINSEKTLTVILGPDNHFSEGDMVPLALPDSVKMELH